MFDILRHAPSLMTLVRYRNKTLQQVFDECGLSKEAQAVLSANAGDLGEPPSRLSIFPYAGLFGGYNTGAYYPTKHFKGYIKALTDSIESHEGCHIYYETEAAGIETEGGRVTAVTTQHGKRFTAEKGIICNMDPQAAAKRLIGWDKFPVSEQKKLTYDYSFTGVMIYLGIKPSLDLRQFGFGNYNIWHMEDWNMNELWDNQMDLNFDKMWWFMSTPTFHSTEPGTVPETGGQILEIATNVPAQPFLDAKERGYAEYAKLKLGIANKLLDRIERDYIPELRKHIAVQQVGSPTTNEDYVMAPFGNAYGSTMTPKQMGLGRLKAWTPFENFYWCNASSGFAGIAGTLTTGMQLYMDLTGDTFYTQDMYISDDDLIAAL